MIQEKKNRTYFTLYKDGINVTPNPVHINVPHNVQKFKVWTTSLGCRLIPCSRSASTVIFCSRSVLTDSFCCPFCTSNFVSSLSFCWQNKVQHEIMRRMISSLIASSRYLMVLYPNNRAQCKVVVSKIELRWKLMFYKVVDIKDNLNLLKHIFMFFVGIFHRNMSLSSLDGFCILNCHSIPGNRR